MNNILGVLNLIFSFQKFNLCVEVCKNQELQNDRNKKFCGSNNEAKHTMAPVNFMGRKKEDCLAPVQRLKTQPAAQDMFNENKSVTESLSVKGRLFQGAGSNKKRYDHGVPASRRPFQALSGGGIMPSTRQAARGNKNYVN